MSFDVWKVVNVTVSLAGWAGLLFSIWNARRSKAAHWINSLDAEFRHHQKVYLRMQPGGEWFKAGTGPTSPEDVADVKAVLDFFEKVSQLISRREIDMATIDQMFAYRFFHIVHNPNTHRVIDGCETGAVPSGEYFSALRALYDRWVRHRKGREIPRETEMLAKDDGAERATSVGVRGLLRDHLLMM